MIVFATMLLRVFKSFISSLQLLKESLEQEKKVEMLVKQEAELKGQVIFQNCFLNTEVD